MSIAKPIWSSIANMTFDEFKSKQDRLLQEYFNFIVASSDEAELILKKQLVSTTNG